MQPKKIKGTVIYIIAFIGILISGFIVYSNLIEKEGYSYSEVITLFEEGKVSEYTLDLNKGKPKFKL